MTRFYQLIFLTFVMAIWVIPAEAQWTSQTITLQPGWNAVFLEVQPEPDAINAIRAANGSGE